MKIKSLTLNGFKSFADKTTIEFQDGLTGIVGPNGSGKSNIIESLRWVLGEQSAKNLRGGKMPDVIFAGSQTRAPLNRCEVSVVFDNTDQYLKGQPDILTITRKIYRNGDSEYLINQKKVRLRDIVDLFTDTGIGRESFSVISQGSVEAIFNSKPQDRRILIEEAAGVVKYKKEKNKAKQELAETTDHLDRVADILNELARQKEPLEQQASVAKDYLEQEKQYKQFELARLVLEIKATKADKKALEAKLAEVDAVVAKHEHSSQLLERKNAKLHDQQQKLEAKLDQAQKDLVILTRQKEKLLSKQDLSLHDKEFFNQRILENQAEMKETQTLVTDAEANLNQLEQKLLKEQAKKAKLNEQLAALEQELNFSPEEFSQQLEQEQAKLTQTNRQKDRLENQLLLGQKEYKRLNENQAKLAASLNQLKEQMATKEPLLQAAKEFLATQTKALADFRATRKAQNEQQIKLSRRYQDAQRRWLDASGILQKAQVRYDNQQQLASSYAGYYRGVKAVMQANLKGIIGPVAEVLNVPHEYALAVEKALGASLQNIVTADVASAKDAIRYLTAKRLGRATFLPQTSVKARFINTNKLAVIKKLPGYLGILSDLVSVTKGNEPIVRHLLGAIVLADDLDHATLLAKESDYSVKIVTLAGDIINAGGSMSGGADRNHTDGLLEQKQNMATLKEQIELMKQKLKTVEIEGQKLKEALDASNNELENQQAREQKLLEKEANAKNSYDELRLEYAQLTQQLTQKTNEYEAQKEILLASDQDSLKNELKDLEQELKVQTQALAEKRLYQKDQAKLKNKIDADLSAKRSEAAVIAERIDSLLIRKKEFLLQLQQAKDRLEKLTLRIEQMQNESQNTLLNQDELQKKTQQVKAQYDQLEVEVNDLKQKRTQLHTDVKQAEQDLTRANELLKAALDEKSGLATQNGQFKALLNHNLDALAEQYALSFEMAAAKNTQTDLNYVKQQVKLLKLGIKELGDVNVQAITQYDEVKKRYDFLSQQQDDLLEAKAQLLTSMDEMDLEVKKRFKQTFEQVAKAFNEIFPAVFGGGHAELSLTEPKDLLNTGIEIMAAPPGKKFRQLSLLSGGERSLTAIVLLFAILKVKPVPFAILDEAEAALDDANVVRYSQYLQKFDGKTQFIVITHRKGTMMQADVLYGVTMQESGVSKIVSVALDEAKAKGMN